MSKQIIVRQIPLPRLRESRVPWLDLEQAINASNALGQLLATTISHNLEDGVCTDPGILAGVSELSSSTARQLKHAFDKAHDQHQREREL